MEVKPAAPITAPIVMTGQEFQTVVPKIRKRRTQVKAMLRAAGAVQR